MYPDTKTCQPAVIETIQTKPFPIRGKSRNSQVCLLRQVIFNDFFWYWICTGNHVSLVNWTLYGFTYLVVFEAAPSVLHLRNYLSGSDPFGAKFFSTAAKDIDKQLVKEDTLGLFFVEFRQ